VTWHVLETGLRQSSKHFPVLGVNTNGDIYAGRNGGIYRSADHGETWMHIPMVHPLHGVTSMAFTEAGEVFVGFGDKGVQYSRDDGETWIDVGSGLALPGVLSMTINADGYLFAGSGDGVYRSQEAVDQEPFTPTAVEAIGEGVPEAFTLSQNYPNPFNPATAITFHLPTESPVALTVFDALGRVVQVLAEGRYPAGSYRVQWGGRDAAGQPVASGVYLYRLQAGSFVQSQTMVLAK